MELDFVLKLALIPFLNQFKRDGEKWVEKCKRSSNKGKIGNLKRRHPDLYLQVEKEELIVDEAVSIAKHRPIPKSLKNDSVSDSKKIIKIKKVLPLNFNIIVKEDKNIVDS